ncbi:2-polyprenyl-3-methyl-6-methoxy-1,4-benzoquinone monooxygenase [Halomonas sp. M5N1S17]|uniref:3-demethoxyubiquinol 3-hydroxylase n=1 Tax=Halomonas chromatireducens TaxID=507626 RepID=A0A0X8HEQ1_9GAMM|nr:MULTISPECIES: 2-polyprenyl-3-methyl-6-methoxy-1,4-benzoquinone monooxygenase [Halomonas]AMD01260.1 2-nonaprenyl-3-methyl-6-methoxy-1,4-benzoquinol hydroxylase [Halomonas chromatireducens]MBZ0329949.1 2-polyprenyl-3-methyl-6-methoxy-1,4-benzoquinone monooxygenase [Halomonas sp. ANAO-440]MCE9665350.1 2-polyprenyl-3-methyl-6-methoxy-1,4-benzoquinone monooxygenase [Halomonas alkalisoli]
MSRKLTHADTLIHQFDTVLRTLVPHAARSSRPSPVTADIDDDPMTLDERRHAAGLMRVNHTGEVCAQALYQGQGCTAKLPEVREQMEHSAQEEIDHLAWCDERLQELGGRTSLLNPLFYAASFGLGAVAGAVGDRVSLGFVAATEEQVGKHLNEHLETLPPGDHRSRAVLRQMAIDEAHHAQLALEAGGARFPAPVKFGMSLMSKVMTKSVYRI